MTLERSDAPYNKPAPKELQRSHLTYLDGIRGIAAALVVLHHIWLTVWGVWTGGEFPAALEWWVTGWLLFGGRMAVAVFIVLSGFCLMIPILRSDDGLSLVGGSRLFFAKRFIRIVPTYYAALILSLVLIKILIGRPTGTMWDYSIPVKAKHIVAHMLLIQNIWGPFQINYSMWTIAVEWQIYFLFPLLLLLWKRIGLKMSTAAVFVVSLGLAFMLQNGRYEALTSQYIALFFLGMIACYIALGAGPERIVVQRILSAKVLCLCTILYAGGLNWVGWTRYSRDLSIPTDILTGTLAAAWIANLTLQAQSQTSSSAVGLLMSRPIAALGTIAYSLYLIHAPLIQVIWQHIVQPEIVVRFGLSPVGAFIALSVVAVPFVLSLSTIFYRIAELPFHKIAQAYGRK